MPFIRHARDKRGYESTFVMHAYRGGNGASRTRVLYVFRSPSNLKVGRKALEPEVVEALEHTHPDLTFDWTVLLREPTLPRVEPRERDRWQRPARRGDQGRPPAEPAPPPVVEDESLLGRTLGAREAARLRARYHELLQRIARRARTPEDRDRLTDRLHRLNPEDWADEAAIRAAAPTVEAEWTAVAAELPSRRRGRRGGRFRGDQHQGAAVPASDGAPDGSGIITGEGESYEEGPDAFDTSPLEHVEQDGQDADHAGSGHGELDGAEHAAAAADHPGPAGDAGPDETGPDGAGVPGRDGHSHD